ncbi:hypothetical protein C8R47DRAFT_1084763 [Mycena vitilis]|nr:hypothetical protein C8R47DRAFT_1084763 [Mycena vitilis]
MSFDSATLSDSSVSYERPEGITPRVTGAMFAAFEGKRVKVVATLIENGVTSLKMSASDDVIIFVLVSQDKFTTNNMLLGSNHEIVGKVVSHESILMERMLALVDVVHDSCLRSPCVHKCRDFLLIRLITRGDLRTNCHCGVTHALSLHVHFIVQIALRSPPHFPSAPPQKSCSWKGWRIFTRPALAFPFSSVWLPLAGIQLTVIVLEPIARIYVARTVALNYNIVLSYVAVYVAKLPTTHIQKACALDHKLDDVIRSKL